MKTRLRSGETCVIHNTHLNVGVTVTHKSHDRGRLWPSKVDPVIVLTVFEARVAPSTPACSMIRERVTHYSPPACPRILAGYRPATS